MISQRGTAAKRRPKSFLNLEGQDFVVETLKNSISSLKVANAYLFSGPRGVGKTSAARAFARALNCLKGPTLEPCGECVSCRGIDNGNSIDIIEIDGASHTSVQDIRDLKEDIMFAPTSSKYKIYIIDEVHMLSNSAFNALLKTIEEPPSYIIFIFATTEIHKVPETIKSRCQSFYFRLLPLEMVYSMLEKICREEGIKYEREALEWIAYKGGGSVRDSYTIFDQIVSFSQGSLSLDKIKKQLGLTEEKILEELLIFINREDINNVIESLNEILLRGNTVEQFTLDLIDYLRGFLFLKIGIKNFTHLGFNYSKELLDLFTIEGIERALSLLFEFSRNLNYSVNPRYELELLLIKLAKIQKQLSNEELIKELKSLENTILSLETSPSLIEESDEVETLESSKSREDEIKENFKNILHKYVPTLVYSGALILNNNELIYKLSSQFEVNTIRPYEIDIIRDFDRYNFNLKVKIISDDLSSLDDTQTASLNVKNESKLDSFKKFFDALEIKEDK